MSNLVINDVEILQALPVGTVLKGVHATPDHHVSCVVVKILSDEWATTPVISTLPSSRVSSLIPSSSLPVMYPFPVWKILD